MQIGEIIREHRKRKNMTQEEVANRLGVTAPAVNKWENGNSQPDIMMLAPIARLLGVTLDALLSFQEELTAEEINDVIYEMDSKLKNETFEEAFQWAKERIEEYPNCERLIWEAAVVLEGSLLSKGIPDSDEYEAYINDCFVRALASEDEDIRVGAADSLFAIYSNKERYEEAEACLKYLSGQNPERKEKQAFIYSKTNRVKEAYKAYEELLLSGYERMNKVFFDIYRLAMRENDREKARMLVDKQRKLAQLFEMGEYHAALCKLDLATAEKDVKETIETMEKMLSSVPSILGFTKSALYGHMEFKEVKEEYFAELNENLRECFREEGTYGYMKENERWRELANGAIPKF